MVECVKEIRSGVRKLTWAQRKIEATEGAVVGKKAVGADRPVRPEAIRQRSSERWRERLS